MEIINAFTGVGVAGMSRTLHVAEAAAAAAAHPAFMPHAAWSRRRHCAAAQAPHRHRDWRVRGSGHHLGRAHEKPKRPRTRSHRIRGL